MTVRYWVSNTAGLAQTLTAWNTATDGSGSSGVPGAGDVAVFGAGNSDGTGFGKCSWTTLSAITLDEIVILSGYKQNVIQTTTNATIDAASAKITLNDGFFTDFYAGMSVTITNSHRNDLTRTVSSVSGNTITFTAALTVDETIADYQVEITHDEERLVDLQTDVTVNGLRLDGTIASPATRVISFTGNHITSSAYLSTDYDDRYILNGPNAIIQSAENLTYDVTGTLQTNPTHWDNGPHPIFKTSVDTQFSPQYKTPTSTVFDATTFYRLNLAHALATIAPDNTTNNAANDFKKSFIISNDSTSPNSFIYYPDTFNAGLSTWVFPCGSNWPLPVTGTTDSNYGQGNGFTAYYHTIQITSPNTQGNSIIFPAGCKLFCYNLIIGQNAMIKAATGQTSTIACINKPAIFGTWNFIQMSPNEYQAHPEYLTGYYENLTIGNKLTVGGLIDPPTGLELEPQASNPHNANTVWINSSDSDKLYFGASEVGGGGGSSYTDADAIAAVEGEATLALTGEVQMTVAPAAPASGVAIGKGNNYADTLGVRTQYGYLDIGPKNGSYCHLYTDRNKFYFNKQIEFDAGVLSAYNDDMTLLTDGTSSTGLERIRIKKGATATKVGIGETDPDCALHVTSASTEDYILRTQGGDGNLRINRYGHIQLQNDNSSPLDGDTIDNPLFQIGQRDSGQIDFAFGDLSGQLVGSSDAIMSMGRVGNVASGDIEMGFFGASKVVQQGPIAAPPTMPMGDATANALAIGQIITALTNLGLIQ